MSFNYIWPLSARSALDETNTSFGPRVKFDKWDFHNGIHLPAPIGIRETTAILYLEIAGKMTECARLKWDFTSHEPRWLRAGIGFSSTQSSAKVLFDELWLTESELPT